MTSPERKQANPIDISLYLFYITICVFFTHCLCKGGVWSLNLSNKITLSRIFIIPLFMIFAFPLPGVLGTLIPYGVRCIVSLVLFVIAEFSDLADGKIARKLNQVTDFGKFLDPIADKLLVSAALLCICAERAMYVWPTMVILIREFAVTGLRLIAASKGQVIAAGKLGKLKTGLQTGAISTLLSAKVLGLIYAPLDHFFTICGDIVMILAVIMTIVSGIEYFVKNSEVLKGAK